MEVSIEQFASHAWLLHTALHGPGQFASPAWVSGFIVSDARLAGVQAMQAFTAEEQKAFLRFVTSCSRPPLLGFQYLEPKLCIQVGQTPSYPELPQIMPVTVHCMCAAPSSILSWYFLTALSVQLRVVQMAGSAEERLPSASTCVNLLKLPPYRSADVIRHKLLYAVNNVAGFDLS